MMVDKDKINTSLNILIVCFILYALLTTVIIQDMDKQITYLDDSIYKIELNELLAIYDHDYLQNKTDKQIETICMFSPVERRYYNRCVEDVIEYRDYDIDN